MEIRQFFYRFLKKSKIPVRCIYNEFMPLQRQSLTFPWGPNFTIEVRISSGQ